MTDGQASTVSVRGGGSPSLVVRAVYFLLIGWWASGIWMGLAWLVSITMVGLPLAVWMYGKLQFRVLLYLY